MNELSIENGFVITLCIGRRNTNNVQIIYFFLLKVLQETIVSVTSSAVDQHTSNDFETVEEDGEIEGIFII